MHPARPTKSRRLTLRLGGATAALLVLSGLAPLSASAAETPIPAPDGLSAVTAAASCWEVKVNNPAATDGIYWLYTPALQAPEQFYCDQTTDGGGWALIGRGREDWSQSGEGYGTAAQVRDTVTGTAAFSPRQLSAEKIGALLNNQPVSSLSDGIRLRRATNTTGTTWQEARFSFGTPRNDWSWMFYSVATIKSWSFDGVTGSGGTSTSFGSGSALQRVQTSVSASAGWSNGFGYGANVAGSTAADSYIYKSGTQYARPFTQVYLRPKLLSADINAPIADSGTTAFAQSNMANSLAMPTVWGVSGLGAAGTGIQDTEVSAFAESTGRVFVGGNFAQVQKTSTGGSAVAQSYLAAFDVKTGELITTFRPTFNNQVKTIAALPNGRIAVGGDFSTVNGVAMNGLVVLDATTGAIDTGFTGRLINALTSSGGQATVRSLDVQGNWLYVGGSFTHATGGTTTAQVYSRAAVRLDVTNGTPDKTWTAEFDGTVISLDASSKGDRVYFAGYFANDKGQATLRGAALSATDGSVIPWTIAFNATANYQQAVREVGDSVWIAGSEHMVFSYNRSDMTEKTTTVMSRQGGDGQAIGDDGNVVYAGCHCYFGAYSDVHTNDWTNVGTAWSKASKIESTGAWNASTGVFDQTFSPSFTTREGAGTWAIFTDSTGVSWQGGDFTAVRTGSTGKSWAGGYARFARNDSAAPTSPTGLKATTTATGVDLSWNAATDNSGAVTYQVLRNDRVVATTTALTLSLPAAPADTKYFVRAADASGNVSASTAAVKAGATAPTDPGTPVGSTLVAAGSTWQYLYPTTAPATTWKAVSFDDSSWQSGAAPIGWGDASIKTTLVKPATPPLTSYYRKAVTVADASTIDSVKITTRADDGIVVYVNGTEVARSNMPTGTVTNGTYASSAKTTAAAVAAPVTITVPGSAFTTGTNVLSAEVHSNYKSTPTQSFDLSAEITAKAGGTTDPGNGGGTTDPGNGGGGTTNPGNGGGTTNPGNGGTPLPAGTVVVAGGTTWSYYHQTDAPAATWRDASFDASTWASGAGVLGWGSTSFATQIPVPTGTTTRPLATYFRSSFTIPTGGVPSTGLTITTRADDGVIVFVNGTEVGRSNLPTGAITHTTYATSAISTTNAVANPVTFAVPASALQEGANVIAVQVQSNYKATPNVSFDLSATVK